PRDRPRPSLAVLDPPRLDPRAPRVIAAVLALRDVRRRYSDGYALDVPSLDVFAGEILGVIGPNGSGKSTLLRILGLLERPDAGQVVVGGRAVDARDALAERRRMATVFQEPLLADASVADNAGLGPRFRGVPRAGAAPARVFYAPVSEEVARFVGVETLVAGRVLGREAGVTAVEVGGRVLEVAAVAAAGARVRVGIRPEDVTLTVAEGARVASSARNA